MHAVDLNSEVVVLPGRQQMFDQLERTLQQGRQGAMLLVDIDQFRYFNERHGYYLGDRLLVALGGRLASGCPSCDGPYHLGGDQFALLFHQRGAEQNLDRMISEVSHIADTPFTIDGERCEVDISLGAVLWPGHAGESERLLLLAEAAVRRAKQHGVDYVIHDPEWQSGYEELGRLQSELRRALANGHLDIYFQPKVSLRGGGLSGLEALVRWPHDRRGLLSPDSFIPEAERNGLIRPLSRWMLNAALRQCAQWRSDGVVTTVSVNLSSRDLEDESLVDYVAKLLEAWELDGPQLEVEITESVAIDNFDRCRSMLKQFSAMGVRIAIDDFGTGYASLNYLRQLPVDTIKIDKSFISDICYNRDSIHIVRSIIELAHRLGKEVVAEGVDDIGKWEPLFDHGCDLVQGYQISEPLTAEATTTWLRNRAEQHGSHAVQLH